MIIVLDTTVFTGDPNFGGPFWRIIEARPERWGLRVVCPWPVVEEAIGNRRTALQKELSQLRSHINNGGDAARKYDVDIAGISLSPIIDAFQEAKEAAEMWFTDRLHRLRIEVLPVDQIDHQDTVRRAVLRTRPCNDKGDGYRDTLNWLCVLELAMSTEDEIIWVTANYNDFADLDSPREAPVFHHHLVADLAKHSLTGRALYLTNVAQVQQRIVDEHQIHADPAWATIELEIAAKVVSEITSDLTAWTLDPTECGLPLVARGTFALLEGAEHTRPASIENIADADVLPFKVPFEATCRLQLARGTDGQSMDVIAPDGKPRIIKKELVAIGTVRVNRTDHAVEYLIIDTIIGHDNDPDVIANRNTVRRVAEAIATIANTYSEHLVVQQPNIDIAKMMANFQQPNIDIDSKDAAPVLSPTDTGSQPSDKDRPPTTGDSCGSRPEQEDPHSPEEHPSG